MTTESMEKPSDLKPETIEIPPWELFVSSITAEERSRAWLALIAERCPGIQGAAILIENPADHTFVPLAVWPKASPDLGRLSGVVEETLKERRGSVIPYPEAPELLHIAYPLFQGEAMAGVIAIEARISENITTQIFREIHWGSAWLINLMSARDLGEALTAKNRLGSVLENLAIALRHGKLQQALFEVTNSLRQHFSCARTAIGLSNTSNVKLKALSEAATFDKHTSLVKAYEEAMNEAFDEARPIFSPGEEAGLVGSFPKADALRAVSGAEAVLVFPMIHGARCTGVLILEREKEKFSSADLVWLEAFSSLAAPVIEQRRDAERGAFRRLWQDAKRVLAKIFGPRHLTWKAASLALSLALGFLILFPIEYRVSAKTVIEGEIQRVVAAPFEGFISAAHVRAGDTVSTDQLLAQLDDRDLRIEEARWSSERDQYENRLREAMANHDLTAIQVVSAQLQQFEAQLGLVTEKISRARLTAPFDGIVVSGDLSQQIGAPVEVGKKLFEIAPLRSYRIILQVDEREIRHIQIGQPGRLVMTGIASEPMEFKVAKVTPVATALDGKNYFRVEAALAQASPRLRPGMEGIGKIEVGSRSLWWVLTHSFTDWLILTLWTWMP